MPTLDKSKLSSTTVRRAVLATLGAAGVGTCLPLVTAHAQDETALQEVVVTGSILRRDDLETPSPMTILTAETLDERGINTVAEAAQRLSANNAGTMTGNWSSWGFATGAVAPALRGLTVQATLSIADGMRLAPYPLADDGQRNFVDLGSIPDAIIERVEVLRDGASSTYGADAIAGVVNVITKKEIQGLELGGSYGDSEEGGGAEARFDVTWGMGDLATDGYNFYVSGEYQSNDTLWASDRGYPYNTADLQRTCGASGSCLQNHNWNGITDEIGFFNGSVSVPGVTWVRPVTPGALSGGDPTDALADRYEFLNPAAGCRDFPTVTIDPTQSGTSPLTSCEVDYRGEFMMLEPDVERIGAAMRFTANVGDNAQFYAMANLYKIDTFSQITPLGFNGIPTPPRPATLATYNVILPVYVCTAGRGTVDGMNTGCDATNGTLNPYNPYAAQGLNAQAFVRSPFGRQGAMETTNTRFAMGLDGEFGDGWNYTAGFAASQVDQDYTQSNYMIPQKIMDVVAQGTFNFSDPLATPQDVWDYIAPDSVRNNTSELWQIQATIGKELMDLPGGAMQAALGLAFRDESITAPSANPANDSAPYERYYSLNAVGTSGSRDVQSAFFEFSAPIVDQFELLASARYDDYSSGQDNVSPKVGFKFQPIDMVTLRGTWSEGFRIPSFSEAYGLPTTGYVTRTVDCAQFAAWCATHGNNAAYYTNYALGLTQTGDPELDPEESTSYTVGVILQPMSNLTFTVDWWHIEVDNLITGVTSTAAAEAQYYSNNGVVNIPGITVVPGVPDPAFPNALPLLGFIQSSYTNQDQQVVQGIDFGATTDFQFGAVNWTSSLELSYLERFELRTDDGRILDYEDTLSPCNITSCSGAPEWRGNWQNTFQFAATSVTLTAYYTKGYSTASIDFGGRAKQCEYNASIVASTQSFMDGTPFNCRTDDQWNVDLTVRHDFNDNLTGFVDVMNVLDIEAEFDPSAAYSLYNYNPSWAGPNAMGRFFRVGAKYRF
jgi:iron complex outermembrane receptor protein